MLQGQFPRRVTPDPDRCRNLLSIDGEIAAAAVRFVVPPRNDGLTLMYLCPDTYLILDNIILHHLNLFQRFGHRVSF